jgi:signal transduction histidine kinase
VVEATTYLAQGLLLAVAIYVAWNTISSPRRSNYLILTFFALLAGIIAFTWVLRFVQIFPGGYGEYLPVFMVLALPYVLLRLAKEYSSVNQLVQRLSEAALAISLILAVFPGTDYFPILSALLIYFVSVSAYAAYRFHAGSIDANGITRMRLRALSNASVLLGIALFSVVFSTLLEGFASASVEVLRQLMLMGSATLYFVGFSPPVLFRRAWQEPELRRFLHRTLQLPRWAPLDEATAHIEAATAETIGAPFASLGIWNEETGLLDFDQVSVKPGETIGGRAFIEQRAILSLDTLTDDPESSDLYLQRDAFAVIAAPITSEDGAIGVIAVYSPNPPIFAEDDLELLDLLADQIGVLLENRKHLHAQAELAAREESTRLKDEFLSVAAHDLKTPLTTILATSQYLERRLMKEKGEGPDLRSVRRLNREAIRLRSLVQGLLDASRIEQGQLITNVEPTQVDKLVDEVLERVKAYNTHILDADIESNVFADCDPVRVQQVIENLIENAQKYSASGSTVRVRLWQDDDQVFVEVTDQGIGIAPDDQPKIFERYYRSSETERSSAQGIGLGLYICKAIIEQHGGDIEVESVPGQGSTFRFALLRSMNVPDGRNGDQGALANDQLLQQHGAGSPRASE